MQQKSAMDTIAKWKHHVLEQLESSSSFAEELDEMRQLLLHRFENLLVFAGNSADADDEDSLEVNHRFFVATQPLRSKMSRRHRPRSPETNNIQVINAQGRSDGIVDTPHNSVVLDHSLAPASQLDARHLYTRHSSKTPQLHRTASGRGKSKNMWASSLYFGYFRLKAPGSSNKSG